MDIDDDLDIRLRAPRLVVERLVVLAAVTRRAILERLPDDVQISDGTDQHHEDPESGRFDLVGWLREEKLDRVATEGERSLLHTRIGRLPAEEAARATWAGEAMVALAWCGGIVAEFPPYGEATDIASVLDFIPSPWESVKPLFARFELRPQAEIAAEREKSELWLWRAGIEAVFRQAAPDERGELKSLIAEVTHEAVSAGLLPAASSGDFSAPNRPVTRLDAATLDELTATAQERLRALNWVCGFGDSWDDVPVEI